jgi:hypothetical protein
MWHQRVRNTGFALIGAALSVVAWKTVALGSRPDGRGNAAGPEGMPAQAGPAVLTIPVEIVEAGKAPRLHEIRVSP